MRALLSVLILCMSAMPLSSEANCDKAYVTFVEHLTSTLTDGDRLAYLHRAGLRIFYACDSGHLPDPDPQFRALEKS